MDTKMFNSLLKKPIELECLLKKPKELDCLLKKPKELECLFKKIFSVRKVSKNK
jgi:hypothetical protein